MDVISVKGVGLISKSIYHDTVAVGVAGKGNGLLPSFDYIEPVFYIDSNWDI
jgi:hypothetical protein